MHTKEVICWQCKAPNQVEDNAPELLEALEKIADTSPNWMQKNAVEDSERRMRQIAIEAIRKAKEKQ